jgi:hypothetical protein
MPVLAIPTLNIQIQASPSVNPVNLITLGNLTFTATSMMYNPQFPINATTSASPNVVPFELDPSTVPGNAAPFAYVRNLDAAAVISVMLGQPSNGLTISPSTANLFSIGPGGFIFFFNQKGVVGRTGQIPGDSVGLGATNSTIVLLPSTMSIFISTPSANTRIVYAEILIAG